MGGVSWDAVLVRDMNELYLLRIEKKPNNPTTVAHSRGYFYKKWGVSELRQTEKNEMYAFML